MVPDPGVAETLRGLPIALPANSVHCPRMDSFIPLVKIVFYGKLDLPQKHKAMNIMLRLKFSFLCCVALLAGCGTTLTTMEVETDKGLLVR